MKKDTLQSNKISFLILFLGVSFLGYLVVKPFIGVVLMAFITVWIFEPVFLKLKSKLKNEVLSLSLTLIVMLMSIGLPLLLLTQVVYSQILIFRDDVTEVINTGQLNSEDILENINEILLKLPGDNQLSEEDVIAGLSNVIAPVGNTLTQNLGQITQTSFMLLTKLVVYVTVVLTLLPNKQKILKFIKQLSPFPEDFDDLYIKRISAMTLSMVKGTFVIAFVQGLFSALLLYILNVPYVAFWSLLVVFFSIIPVGAGIVLIPISIFLALVGNIYGAIFLFLMNALVVTNIDNVLRPMLVSKDAKLNSTLTLIGVLGGIQAFGFMGVIYGPVIMIILSTTIEIYIKHFNAGKEV